MDAFSDDAEDDITDSIDSMVTSSGKQQNELMRSAGDDDEGIDDNSSCSIETDELETPSEGIKSLRKANSW